MIRKQVIKASLSEQIYSNLRLALMEGEYHPGQRLTIVRIGMSPKKEQRAAVKAQLARLIGLFPG